MGLISHVLDDNNLPSKYIEIGTLYRILHLVLRGLEKNAVSHKSESNPNYRSLLNSVSTNMEASMPNSLGIFRVTHEYLASISNCTRDNGMILIHALNAVTAIRHEYAENVEMLSFVKQMTYCLYGIPSTSINDHNCPKVELTWEIAEKLYNLYRPITIPVFYSTR